jgi:hypothetical protein
MAPSKSSSSWSLSVEEFDRIKSTRDSAGRINKDWPYSRTRQVMHGKTRRMSVLASRGFERHGYLPTKKTTPRLLKRRYSIDVSVSSEAGWKDADNFEVPATSASCGEIEPPVQREPALALPSPFRYLQFSADTIKRPPHNEEKFVTFGDVTLSNFNFLHMGDMHGHEAWMADDSLNMALAEMCHRFSCHLHGIDIVNSNITQMLHLVNTFGDGPEHDYLRDRFTGKNWIFIPINDGLDGDTATHWSLLAIDRIHKEAVYYDSVNPRASTIQRLAESVGVGLLKLLEEDPQEWNLWPQDNSPNQWDHSQSPEDSGACGPFVWQMCETMISHIRSHQVDNREANCSLILASDFAEGFKSFFNSQRVRWRMQWFLAALKRGLESAQIMDEHDQAAVADEDVVMSDVVPAFIFSTPRFMLQSAATATRESDDSYESSVDFTDSDFDGLESDHGDQTAVNGTAVDQDDTDDEAGGIRLDHDHSTVVDTNEAQEISHRLPSQSAEPTVDTRLNNYAALQDHHHRRQGSIDSDDWGSVDGS